MKIQWTLTTDIPVLCLGLFDTQEDAQAFAEENKLSGFTTTIVITSEESK